MPTLSSKTGKSHVKSESGVKVGIFRTDSGGEYTSDEFETYLHKEGIYHQLTAPHTSAQNGKVERCHCTIMNRAHAIRSDTDLPPSLWRECVRAAGYLKNLSTTRSLKSKTPHEAWYDQHPDLTHLRELGCRAWVFVVDNNLKIYNRSIECKLVSYSDNSKAYHCWDKWSGQIHTTQNVVFAESQDLRE